MALACSAPILGAGDLLAATHDGASLLPKTTKGFISVADVEALQAGFGKTQIGKLLEDPVMKPFADDLKEQMRKQWLQTHQKLGISWEDLDGVPGGEVCIGIIQPSRNEAAVAVVVDITGHDAQAGALLKKVTTNLEQRKAKHTTKDMHGVQVTVFDIPKTEDHPAAQALHAVKDEVLIATDSMPVMEQILANFASDKASLASVKAYTECMNRCKQAAGEVAPHARWFVEPFGYAEAMRAAAQDRQRRKGQDMLKILQNQGFTAVQGLGGYVNFAVDKYEVLHRTSVYAPAIGKGADRYQLAARMLDLPNSAELKPAPFIPREIATFARINIKMQNAFEASKTLVNEIVGDEVFEDVLKSILEDPNGPQINIRKDLVALLGTHATLVTDYQLPITPKSERMLVAAETSDPTKLAATIEKAMKTDPDAKRREYKGHVIWEIVNEPSQLPMVTIENNPTFGPAGKKDEEEGGEEEEKRMLPNSAVTVANGHLLIATHLDFLIKILDSQDKPLASSADYELVAAELDKLGGGEKCIQGFSRTDEEYRAVYELIRTGKMPEAETMLGGMLNRMSGTSKEGVLRTQKIDGSKLPDFETVRRYFGPAGLTAVSEENGWFITGITLTKE